MRSPLVCPPDDWWLRPVSRPDVSQTGQSIDAALVLPFAIRRETLEPFVLRPCGQLRALTLMVVERHTEPAGVGDAVEPDANDGARAGVPWEYGQQGCKILIALCQDLAAPVQPQDARRTVKGTEHEDDAPVLLQMRRRLDATARQVQVGHRARIEDAECVEPFGREIEMSIQPRRGSGHE